MKTDNYRRITHARRATLILISVALLHAGTTVVAAEDKQGKIDAAFNEWKDSEENLAKLTGKLAALREV